MNKRLEAVNIQIDSNMDADDYGQRVVECVRKCNPDQNVVNLIKIKVGDVTAEQIGRFIPDLRDMIKECGVTNCVFVPIGKRVGVKDITIDYIKVVDDEPNE